MMILPSDLSDFSYKFSGDAVSVSFLLATFADWLPPIAAIFSIIWVCIRIYETHTVQSFLPMKWRLRPYDAPTAVLIVPPPKD